MSANRVAVHIQVDLWTNFQDYGLRSPVGLLRADAHTMPLRWPACSKTPACHSAKRDMSKWKRSGN